MAHSNPLYLQILFLGDAVRGQQLAALAAERNWIVYRPATALQALGEYVFYTPHVVIIEDSGCPGWTADAFYHLHSLGDDTPMLLTGTPDLSASHEAPDASLSYVMVPPDQPQALLDIAADTVRGHLTTV